MRPIKLYFPESISQFHIYSEQHTCNYMEYNDSDLGVFIKSSTGSKNRIEPSKCLICIGVYIKDRFSTTTKAL